MFCSSEPSLVVLAQTVLEIFDGKFWGIPHFSQKFAIRLPQKNLKNVWEGVSDET